MMPTVLLITGAASGIGAATARLAAQRGFSLGLLDRDAERLEATAAEVGRFGESEIHPLVCDVSDEAAVESSIVAAAERLGPPFGLVAAAGIDRGGPLDELSTSEWDEVIGVNLRGTFLTCRASLRYMLSSGAGSIVCLSSPLALAATAGGSVAYSASKAGISALVRSMAVTYGGRGVRVNALLPGPTETDLMWAGVPEKEIPGLREIVASEVPLARLANPEEVAGVALWLLSDDSSYVTGAQIACDGGVLAKASISR